MFPSKRNRTSRKNNNESKSVNFTIEEEDSNNRLATINTDIEKLFKKYSDIKKKRLNKEKTQQILVNRIKYLKNEFNRSLSKKEKKLQNKSNTNKIQIIFGQSYVSSKEGNKYKNEVTKNSNSTFNEKDNIRKSYGDIKIKNNNDIRNNYLDKENISNLSNVISSRNNIENILRRNRCHIGNNNSNNNIYIIINNTKNLNGEKYIDNHLETINKNISKNYNRQERNTQNFHLKNKSENNFIISNQKGENIILMKTDGQKLQDIINSINNINNNINNNLENINKKGATSLEKNEVIKKKNTRNKSNSLLKNYERNKEFMRPNFLDLYNNEDSGITKQKIDMCTFNKTENSFLQMTESFLANNNNLIDKSGEVDKNSFKQKTKKKTVIKDLINNKNNNNNNEINNILYNTVQSFSSNETINKKEKDYSDKRVLNQDVKEFKNSEFNNKNKLKNLNNSDKYEPINNQINSIQQSLNNNKDLNCLKLRHINSENSRTKYFRNDSYSNSIENKRKALGLEFKPNIKRELSVKAEQNSEKKNKLLKKIKTDAKFNNLLEKDKLIKVKKRNILNNSKKKACRNNNLNLIKHKTMSNLMINKKHLNITERNEMSIRQSYNKKDYHIYI